MILRVLSAVLFFATVTLLLSCTGRDSRTGSESPPDDRPYLYLLGVAQDGGIPQAGDPDHPGWKDPERGRKVVSLGLVDPVSKQLWMFDATPDFPEQLHRLQRISGIIKGDRPLDGIFLTHAHMGHYTGLMHLGFEAMGADSVPVHAMQQMRSYLLKNGPWDQLVRYGNIALRSLEHRTPVRLNARLTVTPIRVPHRQEYSETVGYRIEGPEKSVLFIPDIDSWEAWDRQSIRIEEELLKVDYAFLDGTFFANGEIPGRDMSGFPHPFISESMERFGGLPQTEKDKIHFIHFNHTNPVVRPDSRERMQVHQNGFHLAREGAVIGL